MLYQLIYRSRYVSAVGGASSALRDIVAASERNNARDRLTGFLVFDKLHFLQILEGDEADVERAFSRIEADPRHDDIAVIARRSIDHRAFPEWAMGGCVRSAEVDHIYQSHRSGGDPSQADADDLVELAREIADWEARRAQSRGLSRY